MFREDSLAEIHTAQTRRRTEIEETQHFNQNGIVITFKLACKFFATGWDRREYDKHGDRPFNPASLTITDQYPDFYENHKLYVAVGACKTDTIPKVKDRRA